MGGNQGSRKMETNNELNNEAERQHHPMDWSHIRGRQVSYPRQEKMEIYGMTRQSTRQSVIYKSKKLV